MPSPLFSLWTKAGTHAKGTPGLSTCNQASAPGLTGLDQISFVIGDGKLDASKSYFFVRSVDWS